MPRNPLGRIPFRLQVLDLEGAFTEAHLEQLLKQTPSVSLCLRTASGAEERGGFFFHFERVGAGFELFDFQHTKVDTLDRRHLVALINHVSGRRFSEEMLRYCQTVINLRQDPDAPA